MPLLIEYLRKDGEPLRLVDLGLDYLDKLKLPIAEASRPFRVEASAQISRSGNAYFDYSQGSIPLPDGLETRLRVGGVEVKLGPERESQRGNPMREGKTAIAIDGLPYEVTVYVTQGRQQFWVKVHAQKASGKAKPAGKTPITGGRLV